MNIYLELLAKAKDRASNNGQGYGYASHADYAVTIYKSRRGARWHLTQAWTRGGAKITKAEARAALGAAQEGRAKEDGHDH